eukprot:g11502.t1
MAAEVRENSDTSTAGKPDEVVQGADNNNVDGEVENDGHQEEHRAKGGAASFAASGGPSSSPSSTPRSSTLASDWLAIARDLAGALVSSSVSTGPGASGPDAGEQGPPQTREEARSFFSLKKRKLATGAGFMAAEVFEDSEMVVGGGGGAGEGSAGSGEMGGQAQAQAERLQEDTATVGPSDPASGTESAERDADGHTAFASTMLEAATGTGGVGGAPESVAQEKQKLNKETHGDGHSRGIAAQAQRLGLFSGLFNRLGFGRGQGAPAAGQPPAIPALAMPVQPLVHLAGPQVVTAPAPLGSGLLGRIAGGLGGYLTTGTSPPIALMEEGSHLSPTAPGSYLGKQGRGKSANGYARNEPCRAPSGSSGLRLLSVAVRLSRLL